MRYQIISKDSEQRTRWETRLGDAGFDIVDSYESDVVLVTLGGDGTILYAARQFPEPTILPVRTGDSVGYRTTLETDELEASLEALETGTRGEDYTVIEHEKIAAYRNGKQLCGTFDALNEISLHHSSPVRAAVLAVRIRDRGKTDEFGRIIGDGVLVSTPFGSSAYYRSITGGTFSDGLGVAFNNVHTPVDAPEYRVLSSDAIVELEVVESEHASGAVLTRDNDDEMYELDVGEPITIRGSSATVDLIDPEREDA